MLDISKHSDQTYISNDKMEFWFYNLENLTYFCSENILKYVKQKIAEN